MPTLFILLLNNCVFLGVRIVLLRGFPLPDVVLIVLAAVALAVVVIVTDCGILCPISLLIMKAE